jgi:hypothetical protein
VYLFFLKVMAGLLSLMELATPVLPKEQRLFELFYKNTVITHVNGER